MDDSSSVRVAVRIRPPLTREVIDGCQICTSVTPDTPQVWIGGNHAFTYDYVFDSDSSQDTVFQTVTDVVDGCLEGYNATILAYGQTGSGKTYTMGTGFDVESLNSTVLSDNQGIIPRAVHHLFTQIDRIRQEAVDEGHPAPEFTVNAQFVELYNEEVFDLIDPDAKGACDNNRNSNNNNNANLFRPVSSPSDTKISDNVTVGNKPSGTGINRRPQTTGSIKIHEDPTGGIYLVGIGTKQVDNADVTMKCLRNGALSRTTASTNMNDQSSRSHAIFTLHIKQQRVVSNDEVPESQTEFETLSAKFHFVDLAGSERLKRTGAVGERAKEGISINCGLLALGNVISALGDVSKKVSHVPYRDSKLTRLLQDSLGGNSRTIMIACVSPCDRDFVETLNSLKYANRARNIKNRVTINQDKSSRTIALLKEQIQSLQTELLDYKQGKRSGDEVTDTWHENVMLTTENTSLKSRVKAMQETIDKLTVKNSELLADQICGDSGADSNCDFASLVKGYMREIEELRAKLYEAEATCEGMRKSLSPKSKVLSPRNNNNTDLVELIEEAKREVEKDEESLRNLEFANTCDTDESDDDSNEDERNERNLTADIQLAKVTNDISVKLRLIEQLEVSQKRIELMKAQYEEKLLCLSNRIKATELERDKVLQSIKGEGKLKETKDDYEKKLATMKLELKKWQLAQKEHTKMAKSQAQNERQITSLKTEIENMKRLKVKLMNQVKEEGIRWREAEARRVKEINQLKKEQRKRDIAIRTLQGEAKMKDLVLKRKHEEVNALKKMKNINYKTNGVKVSPVKAKARWSRIMGNMVKNVTTKQTLTNLEQEMLSLIEERKGLRDEMEAILKEKIKLQMEMASPGDINLINEDIDNLNAKITYVDEKVNELQRNIVELTGEREEEETPDLNSLVSRLTQQEVGYVFNKMYEQSVASMTESANLSKKALEEEERHKHTQRELVLARDLLQHIMLTHGDGIMLPPEVAAKFHSLKTDYRRDPMHASTESLSSVSNGISDATFVKPSTARSERKARRLTATPSELLMGTNGMMGGSNGESSSSVIPTIEPEPEPNEFSRVNRVRGSFRNRRDTYTVNDPLSLSAAQQLHQQLLQQQQQQQQPPQQTPSEPHRLTNNYNRKTYAVSRTKIGNNNANQGLNTTFLSERSPEHNQYESPSCTPPGSPNSQRKYNHDYNVFQRLFGASGSTTETTGVGVIRNIRSTTSNRSLLVNVSVAEGHSKPVLSVFATEDKLFTGSKDSTIKIWDLNTGTEVQTLVGHANNVVCIQYVEANRMILTASHCFIKVWDMRMHKASCVKTLLSSGGTDDSLKSEAGLRQHMMPTGEHAVNCISVLRNDMYTPFGPRVRRWDLRQFRCIGLLPGKHGSAVTCMALDENSFVTGSKDHSIKVYESTGTGGETNSWNLEPPHYDGIETFAMSNKVLFSGSRDTCIKRWDLNKKEMVASINNAHGDWITGLAFAPKNDSVILSSGRDGVVKLWSVNDCREIGKVDAHKGSVLCLATNSSLIFTGSQDGSVNMWKCRKTNEFSPESSDNSP